METDSGHSNYSDFVCILDALFVYIRELTYSQWQMLERQLSQVDQRNEPEMYAALNSRAEDAFNLWVFQRHMGRGV